MNFEIVYAPRSLSELRALERNPAKAGLLKQVKKSLGYLQINPKHPSLNTYAFTAFENPYNSGEKVFEAYAQNNTPGAYRIFWCYDPAKGQVTILAVTPHP